MHHSIAPGNGAAERVHPQQITNDGFGGESGEIFELAGGADEDT
jgi:hypothetical protein